MKSDLSTNPKQFEICGIGMSMVDLLQVVDEFPSASGVTEAGEIKLLGGGPVPTALCTAARLGAKTAIIDRIGDDWRGRLVAEEYHKFGVNCDHLTLEPKRTSTIGSVLVRRRDGERHVVFSPGDFSPLTTAALPKTMLVEQCQILHLNGRHWPACIDAARWVRENGGLVSFDGGANRYDEKFTELLQITDILIVARDFAERFSGSHDVDNQLASLIGVGAKVAGITDGPNGSWLADAQGQMIHQPAFAVHPVIDTTGCGDAFHGGYLYAHAQGWSLQQAATFATAVAGCNATALGGRGHLPTISEARQIMANGEIS